MNKTGENSKNDHNRPPHGAALDRARLVSKQARKGADGLVRAHYILPRDDARAMAREWLNQYPKAAYWTRVETWRLHGDETIEFTMVRLPTAD